MLDDSVPAYRALQEMFANTELIPKLMLFNNLKEHFLGEGKSLNDARKLAAKRTIASFPVYQNLSPGLAALDSFIPYISFSMSMPRMVLMSMAMNPHKAALMGVTANYAAAASWSLFGNEGDNTKYAKQIDQDYIRLPFNKMIYGGNAFPISNNLLGMPFDFGMQFFPWQVASNIFNANTYWPVKDVHQ